LQENQHDENEEIEFLVLKHMAQGQEAANPGHSTPTPDPLMEWADWQGVLF
jgi:hypothetical protein